MPPLTSQCSVSLYRFCFTGDHSTFSIFHDSRFWSLLAEGFGFRTGISKKRFLHLALLIYRILQPDKPVSAAVPAILEDWENDSKGVSRFFFVSLSLY